MDGGPARAFNVALGSVTELGHTPAQVAPAWTLQNPAVTAPVTGARTLAQLEDNLGAPEVDFAASHLARPDGAGAIALGFPHDVLAGDHIRNVAAGELKIETRR